MPLHTCLHRVLAFFAFLAAACLVGEAQSVQVLPAKAGVVLASRRGEKSGKDQGGSERHAFPSI